MEEFGFKQSKTSEDGGWPAPAKPTGADGSDRSLPQALPQALFPLSPITVIVGHYGVGKTNLSLNLAVNAASAGQVPSLADLDIVNPYFRSSEYGDVLAAAGVELAAPVFAGSTLDSPSLSGRIDALIDSADREHPLILDVGGDDAGATALGRYAKAIAAKEHQVYYVINAYRNLTQSPEEAAALVSDIEAKAKLSLTGVINNSHLQHETTEDIVRRALPFAEKTAVLLDVPLVATAVPRGLASIPKSSALLQRIHTQSPYLVQVYVHTPWE